jgi:hypothetical protein
MPPGTALLGFPLGMTVNVAVLLMSIGHHCGVGAFCK